MCDPISLTSAALLAGGTAANYYGQTQAAQKRDDVLAAERIRQHGYDKEADALNLKSRGLYENFDAKQGQTASDLQALFREASDEPAAPPAGQTAVPQSVMPSATSNITNREIARQQGQADAYVDQQAGALGDLRAFDSLMGDNGRAQARNSTLLNQIFGFKRGSSRVSDMEAAEAAQAGNGLSTLGDLMKGAGSIGLSAGSSGAFAPEVAPLVTPVAVVKQGGKLVAAAPGANPYVIY